LLLDEDRVGIGEGGQALDGCDAGTWTHTYVNQGGGGKEEACSILTDVSQEDQERQQNHEEVAVPNDEAAVQLEKDV